PEMLRSQRDSYPAPTFGYTEASSQLPMAYSHCLDTAQTSLPTQVYSPPARRPLTSGNQYTSLSFIPSQQPEIITSPSSYEHSNPYSRPPKSTAIRHYTKANNTQLLHETSGHQP